MKTKQKKNNILHGFNYMAHFPFQVNYTIFYGIILHIQNPGNKG